MGNPRIGDVALLDVLTDAECEQVIAACDPDGWAVSTRGTATSADMLDGTGQHRFVDLDHKSRTEQPSPSLWLDARVKAAVRQANDMVYGFATDEWEEPFRILRYEAPGDHFVEHIDLGAIHPTRKLSFTLALTDSDHLAFADPYPMRRGQMCVWPSFVRHQVRRITEGVRFVLVGWALGPSFI